MSLILHDASVLPLGEQVIPEKQQELPKLLVKEATSYKEELLKCQKFLSVSVQLTCTYLVE